jgi:hypothetical protein
MNRPRLLLFGLVALAAGAVVARPALAAPACPISYGTTDDAKPNKVYLYFPTAVDTMFPFQPGGSVAAFNIANLSSYTGTAVALRNAVFDVVADDYCEFNVQVRQTTAWPPSGTLPARRNVVAVGTDTNTAAFGQAQAVDTGDPTLVDYSREWTGTYQFAFGGAGGALNGANSTLERWARSIGGSAAHEAGHNYGLAHSDDATITAGEDALTRHVMPDGGLLDGEARAGYRRHFSDRTFSILASNVGLSIQTMHNWDLTNPNAQVGRRLRMDFLSPNPAVILSWSWGGASSPWLNPTVSGPIGTTTFKGVTYNRFRIEWSTPNPAWPGGAGQVPGGAEFHIGATFSGVDFNQPDPIIITQIQLLDGGGNPLALQPRLPGYDAGTLDATDGAFSIDFANLNNSAPFILRNVVVRELPRVLSINAMRRNVKRLVDWTGRSFPAWPKTERLVLRESKPLRRGQDISITVARLAQSRHVFERIGKNCEGQDNRIPNRRDVSRCRPGISVGLFPATTLYLTATVIDPRAKHWDPRAKKFVVGPLASYVFYQLGGRHPDLNRNHIDDLIDIATKNSADRNHDGVPDEAQKQGFKIRSFAFASLLGSTFWDARRNNGEEHAGRWRRSTATGGNQDRGLLGEQRRRALRTSPGAQLLEPGGARLSSGPGQRPATSA